MSSTALCCCVSYQLYYETFDDVSVSSSLNVGHSGTQVDQDVSPDTEGPEATGQ